MMIQLDNTLSKFEWSLIISYILSQRRVISVKMADVHAYDGLSSFSFQNQIL